MDERASALYDASSCPARISPRTDGAVVDYNEECPLAAEDSEKLFYLISTAQDEHLLDIVPVWVSSEIPLRAILFIAEI